jgi:hypothetical protein
MLLRRHAPSHGSWEARDERAQSAPINRLQGPEEVGLQMIDKKQRLAFWEIVNAFDNLGSLCDLIFFGNYRGAGPITC